jgi:hypothetical protein
LSERVDKMTETVEHRVKEAGGIWRLVWRGTRIQVWQKRDRTATERKRRQRARDAAKRETTEGASNSER